VSATKRLGRILSSTFDLPVERIADLMPAPKLLIQLTLLGGSSAEFAHHPH
jgi:hypothetical protein